MELPGIRGKVAIVTGAGGGIGEAYARGLAAAGARVVVADIAKEAGERVAREIGAEALAIEVDVASPESTRAMAERTAAHFGGIDFLVNNAALFGGMKMAPYMDVDWDYYTRFMNINVNGALLCARACVPHMRKRGGGAIVNQSSTAAWMSAGSTASRSSRQRAHAGPRARAGPAGSASTRSPRADRHRRAQGAEGRRSDRRALPLRRPDRGHGERVSVPALRRRVGHRSGPRVDGGQIMRPRRPMASPSPPRRAT
jgi:NAD(P)-dependent dehydrogenase (short-subunit alcohol dehydrogenase family)